jgi:hypothetical protein
MMLATRYVNACRGHCEDLVTFFFLKVLMNITKI